ncbi:uncharacterized protein PG986_007155 [Apiospora aurea]|uniref:Uncharacterized protein n=1 Tax=Apiospora aurea TaxID=335848 RepID=A0ABR1QBS6_9PEZI
MELLPPEIILGMVEQHMNMATVMQFMQTTKARSPHPNSPQRRTYEASICRAQMAARRLPPAGHVLSSRGPERRVIAANTFAAVLELDVRQERISDALRHDFWNTGSPPLLGPLTRRQQARLLELMRASLCRCDHIADIAAACSHPRAPADTRTAQIDYMASLSTEQLAALFYTVDMAGFGFVRARKYEAEDPLVWEKITVFEECLLRHGSWFLWAHLQGGQASHATQLIEAGLKELTDWETGKEGMLPGLRMSLVDAYRARLGDAHDVDLEASLRERVRRQVMAPQNT